jgi:hypothetical protein
MTMGNMRANAYGRSTCRAGSVHHQAVLLGVQLRPLNCASASSGETSSAEKHTSAATKVGHLCDNLKLLAVAHGFVITDFFCYPCIRLLIATNMDPVVAVNIN